MPTVVNLIVFFWLLLVTAYLVRGHYSRHNDEFLSRLGQLTQELRQSQELLNILSQELLALSEQVAALGGKHDIENSGNGAAQTSAADEGNPIRSRYGAVFTRAQRGEQVTEIARELEMGKGEIELILSLGRQIGGTDHKS